ncbi:MAG: M23 family metallopeptidase [Deinococcus sp.]|nr:M23 family metallopeptidase [Deinococcus sp.]
MGFVVDLTPPRLQVHLPSQLVPGSTLAALITANEAVNAVWAELDQVRYQLVPWEEGYVLLAPIPLSATPGPRQIRLHATDAQGNTGVWEGAVEVVSDSRSVQDITLPPGPAALLAPEAAEARRQESELYNSSLGPVTPRRWQGPFLMPVTTDREISSSFGSRRTINGGPVHFHLGHDIPAPVGTPIVAPAPGLVVLARQVPVRGGLTVLDHGLGLYSAYFHQSALLVQEGQEVAIGQVIGQVGSTGLSTGPHLHWEMTFLEEPVNPLQWVGRLPWE